VVNPVGLDFCGAGGYALGGEGNSKEKAVAPHSLWRIGVGGLALAALAACGRLGEMAGGRGASVTLVREGKAEAAIVLGEKPSRAAQLAAFEIQHHIRKMTGATVPIVREGAAAEGKAPSPYPLPKGEGKAGVGIYVGESARAKALGLTREALKAQEYVIRLRPGEVVLVGRDKDDAGEVKYDGGNLAACDGLPSFWDEQATLYAAYDFLERFCGVRWLNPTDFGTICPQAKTLVVKGADVRRKPFFRFRDAAGAGGDNPDFYDQNSIFWNRGSEEYKAYEAAAYAELHKRYPNPAQYAVAHRNAVRLFLLRMRNGGEVNRCNHSLYGFYNRFWEKSKDPEAAKLFVARRPEMFAQGYDKEATPPQMCYTSRALIEQLAQDARDYYDRKATGREQGIFWNPTLPNLFPVEPMDNSSFCKCAPCQKLLNREAEASRFSTGVHSDYFFNFVNEVAKELHKTHPDKGLVTLAYATHAAVPQRVKLDPSVAVQFCFACNRAPHDRAQYEHEIRLLEEWARPEAAASSPRPSSLAPRPLYLWLYYTFPKEFADNGKYHCFPGFFAHVVGEQMRLFARLGILGMFHCGYGQDVESYVTFKLMDDPTQDVDKLLDDYFGGLYGPAAEPMKQLYLGIEKVFCDPANYPKEKVSGAALSWGHLGTAERMAEFGRLLDKAKAAADTDTVRARIDLFEKAVWSYMVAGREQFVKRQKAAIPALKAPRVADAGGDLGKVDWSKAAPLQDPRLPPDWFDRGGDKPSARKLSGRMAHDGRFFYLELTDACDTKKLVSSAMVFPADDWEVFIAAQRTVPYRQYAVSPSAQIVALSHGETNFRMNVPINDHGVKATSNVGGVSPRRDTRDGDVPPTPDKWVTRMAIPLSEAIPGGVKPGGKLYLNVIRVTCPALSGTGGLGIDSWVSFCTVHEVDRLAEIALE